MNNFILISKTYAETTPESDEIGDYSDTGFVNQCEQVTFKELVKLMKEYTHASQSPHDGYINVYYSTEFYTKDYRTGKEQSTTIHYHTDNTDNAAKYWKLARKFADKPR